MIDVCCQNLVDVTNEIEEKLENCAYITIDAEFSNLITSGKDSSSLFDDGSALYKKFKKNAENCLIIQFGLSIYEYERGTNKYHASVYRFYVLPSGFISENKLMFGSSTLRFLTENNFNFNELAYNSLSYLPRKSEDFCKNLLENGTFLEHVMESISFSHRDKLYAEYDRVLEWFNQVFGSDSLILKPIWKPKEKNFMNLILQLFLRKCSKCIWTDSCENGVRVTKVTQPDYSKSIANESRNIHNEILNELRGFNNIFQLLIDCKKPLVGHNMFADLIIMYSQFYETLPNNYDTFKTKLLNIFPVIYDTKVISSQLYQQLNQLNSSWKNSLSELYKFLESKETKNLLFLSPNVVLSNVKSNDGKEMSFHDASYDAYITGYCFIKMAHLFAGVIQFGDKWKSKEITKTQHFRILDQYENLINVGKGRISYINLAGNDIVENKGPILHASMKDGRKININALKHTLRRFGYLEICPYENNSVQIATSKLAVSNRILNEFKNNKTYRIVVYRSGYHSSFLQNILRYKTIAASVLIIYILIEILGLV